MSEPLFDAEALEAARRLFAGDCRFIWAAATIDRLPPVGLNEVAFLGRSNVGKSSLINGMTGRNDLARASNTPGRTRELIYFAFQQRLWLVDMPGYGYAVASKTEIARWTELIDAYLRGRPTLRRLFLLIDSRHGIKPIDREMMDRLDTNAVSYQLVLTKIDKTTGAALAAMKAEIQAEIAKRPAAHPFILATSSETGAGMPELRAAVAEMASQ